MPRNYDPDKMLAAAKALGMRRQENQRRTRGMSEKRPTYTVNEVVRVYPDQVLTTGPDKATYSSTPKLYQEASAPTDLFGKRLEDQQDLFPHTKKP